MWEPRDLLLWRLLPLGPRRTWARQRGGSLRVRPEAEALVGRPQPLRLLRELDRHSVDQVQGAVLLCNGPVHDRAVPVALNVCLQTLLVRTRPRNVADLARAHGPLPEAPEVRAEAGGIGRGGEVHEGEAECRGRPEVGREVHEVVPAEETLCIQELPQPVASVVAGHIPHHDGRPQILDAAGGGRKPCRCRAGMGAVRQRLAPADAGKSVGWHCCDLLSRNHA
mmetsp:Transcript_103200/g.268774  ORF Transcript_103200/g.268774 Transcript_103200/m.268774 type:complete len:224 (+) Transcript_103200:66-737(+)